MTDELKPCPFCRNAGNIKLVEYRPNCSGAVVCRQCGARGPKAKNDHKRGWKKKAIEGWNTRAERTCHIEFHSEMVSEGGMEGDTWWYCSSCGQELPGWAQDVWNEYDYYDDNDEPMPFCYCPLCGAKVAEAAPC